MIIMKKTTKNKKQLKYMSITITENAADRVKTFLDNRGSGVGLRVGVKTTGCSGMPI